MQGFKGALGASLLIWFFFGLCPPDHDPYVLGAPGYLKVLILVGAVTIIIGGAMLLCSAIMPMTPPTE